MREQYDDDINSTNYWPVTLPPRPLTARALAMLAAGHSQAHVVKATGLTSNRVLAIHRLPEKYDPVDDEVAIQRAMDGDRHVLPQLTFYERETLRGRLVDRYLVEVEKGWTTSSGTPFWLSSLASDWGADYRRLLSRIQKAVQRYREAAAA